MKKYGNPAMFPEKLIYNCIKLFTYPKDVVLDPFNGAGTTTYVAFKNNRNFIGIDIDKKYCKVARDRIVGKYEKK
ncbi:MAG: site-specific DNA-methyltransferase [Mycoplasmoidaceae bacterium]|nr:site-specific DNA-methyltransferase [Mycoplasmoidaceae bacterium]